MEGWKDGWNRYIERFCVMERWDDGGRQGRMEGSKEGLRDGRMVGSKVELSKGGNMGVIEGGR